MPRFTDPRQVAAELTGGWPGMAASLDDLAERIKLSRPEVLSMLRQWQDRGVADRTDGGKWWVATDGQIELDVEILELLGENALDPWELQEAVIDAGRDASVTDILAAIGRLGGQVLGAVAGDRMTYSLKR